ncbi:LysR family transcriptional regulator [Primorskyibacter sp. S187A]|uniref:LysR family transcriptional regulator n=1 Tax=Primorskyibacter sp. S187A TaxID=3415130 RepID=UPI003C7EBCDE
MRNLDVTVLRSFVAVAQCGGVTRAAGFLNLTQSAVSMQLKRLEELMGLELLDRTGRGVALTSAGEQLLGYARRMVSLNDEAFARLTHQDYAGEITLGVPHDIVYPVIPRVLQRFSAEMPRVRVQMSTTYTTKLKRQFAAGQLALMLTTETGAEASLDAQVQTLTEIPLRWFGAPQGQAHKHRPLQLAMGRVCGFRPGVIARLEAAGIPWENAVDTDSDRTIEATTSADLGVTALLDGTAPPQLAEITASDLPELDLHKINLYGLGRSPDTPVARLAEMIQEGYGTL